MNDSILVAYAGLELKTFFCLPIAEIIDLCLSDPLQMELQAVVSCHGMFGSDMDPLQEQQVLLPAIISSAPR